MPAEHLALAVQRQDADDASLLNEYRRLLKWRKATPALRGGETTLFDVQDNVLTFERGEGEAKVLCVYNFSADTVTLQLSPFSARTTGYHLGETSSSEALIQEGQLRLPPFGVAFLF